MKVGGVTDHQVTPEATIVALRVGECKVDRWQNIRDMERERERERERKRDCLVTYTRDIERKRMVEREKEIG